MLRKALAAVGILLVVFHGWLLVGQAWDGQLVELAIVARWLLAGILLWGLYSLRRQGASLFYGRKAVAIWLLAALLHGPAVAERIGTSGSPAPEVVATLAQVLLGAVTVIGVVLLAGLFAFRRRRPAVQVRRERSSHAILGPLSSDAYLRFAPRPPPVA